MKKPTLFKRFTTLFLAALFMLSCNLTNQLQAGQPAPTSQPLMTATPSPTPTGGKQFSVKPTSEAPAAPPDSEKTSPSEPAPTAVKPTTSCTGEACILSGTLLLANPVGGAGRQTIDTSIRYGTYQASKKDAQRGVYFLNSTGTPVLAAADGVVVVAGDDSQTPYTRAPNIYGNLVILRHELPGVSAPVFTLYAHLSAVQVSVDETVTAGQEIGRVGSSGSITGSTLLFEVRFGENHYKAVRNPELWLVPLPDDTGQPRGALVGRIVDAEGNYLQVDNIVIEQLAGPGQPAIDQFYVGTYSGSSLVGGAPYEENFALGGLPAGEYQISFLYNGMRQKEVTVMPGMVTVVAFTLP